jgi:hypothetical protein
MIAMHSLIPDKCRVDPILLHHNRHSEGNKYMYAAHPKYELEWVNTMSQLPPTPYIHLHDILCQHGLERVTLPRLQQTTGHIYTGTARSSQAVL